MFEYFIAELISLMFFENGFAAQADKNILAARITIMIDFLFIQTCSFFHNHRLIIKIVEEQICLLRTSVFAYPDN
jgi:hypothetical protein